MITVLHCSVEAIIDRLNAVVSDSLVAKPRIQRR